MIRNILIMVIAAAVLMVTDDWVRAKWHQPEQQLTYSNWLDKEDKLVIHRPHLDVWLLEHGPIKWICVMSPCKPDKRAGDMTD